MKEARQSSNDSTIFAVLLLAFLPIKLVLLGRTIAGVPSAAALGASLAVLLALSAPIMALRSSRRLPAAIVLSVSLTLIVLADVVHFRFFRTVISASESAQLRQLFGVWPSVAALLKWSDLLYFVDVLLVALAPFVSRAFWIQASHRIAAAPRAAVVLAVCGSLAAPALVAMIRGDDNLFGFEATPLRVVDRFGILPYHVYDLFAHTLPVTNRLPVGEAALRRVAAFLDTLHHESSGGSNLFGVARGQNLIVVMAESLQRFPVGMVIDGQVVTPVLNEFAKESMDFVNFFDQTDAGTTSDGEYTSLQSLYPASRGVVSSRFVTNRFAGLPARLAEAGYVTVSAAGEHASFWNKHEMHPRLGFQRSFFAESYRMTETLGMGLSDRQFFSQTSEKLRTLHAPYFAFLITVTTHYPFRLPSRHRKLRLGKFEGTLLGDYLHSVHYFDSAFGEFLEQLRGDGILDKSVVVVYGDHRAFLEASQGFPELLGLPPSDRYRLWEAGRKVPLLIRLPGAHAAGRREVTGGHVDIAPTLLEILGVDRSRTVMMGTDLTRDTNALVTFRDGSFLDGRNTFLASPTGDAGECFAFGSGTPTHCGSLGPQRVRSRTRLEISDLILERNLIPGLTASRY